MGEPIFSDRPAFIICCHCWFMSLAVRATGSHMSAYPPHTHRAVRLMMLRFIIRRHNKHTEWTFNGVDSTRAFFYSLQHPERLQFGQVRSSVKQFLGAALLPNMQWEITPFQLSVSQCGIRFERARITLGSEMSISWWGNLHLLCDEWLIILLAP